MKLKTTSDAYVNPADLAASLAAASPEEFKAVWMELHRILDERDDDRLDRFAKAMAPDIGSNCYKPLRTLLMLIDFHRLKAIRAEKEAP